MRKLWIPIALLLLAPLVLAAVLLLSPNALTGTLQWGVKEFTSLRLELSGLDLDLDSGELHLDSLHLYQQDAEGAPLFTLLDFQMTTRLQDLWTRELSHTEFSAESVVIYVSARDAAVDPTPRDWLEYLRLLPRRFSVAQVHIINEDREVSIVPLNGLRGEHTASGGFRLQGRAILPHQPLALAVEMSEVQKRNGTARVTLAADMSSPAGSRATIEGEVQARARELAYDFSFSGHYPAIDEFLAVFPDAPPVAGALTVQGRLRGDQRGFSLTDAEFQLDNSPEYRFQASGSLAGATGEDPSLALVASGELATMDLMLRWVGVDLSPLGSARASIALSGTLATPAVDQMTLVTSSSEGLWLSLNGSAGPGSLDALQVPPDSDFTLHLDAPRLAVLQPWLDSALPLDPGPWAASARLRELQGSLVAEDIRLRLGRPGALLVKAAGRIEQVTLGSAQGPGMLTGLDFQLEGASPDLASALADLELPLALPASLALQASARLAGDGDAPRIESGKVNLTRGNAELQLSGLRARVDPELAWYAGDGAGKFDLSIADSRALRDLVPALPDYPARFSLRGRLRQTAETAVSAEALALSLEGPGVALQAEGSADGLPEQPEIGLSVTVDHLDPLALSASLFPEQTLPDQFTTLSGSLRLGWRERELDLQSLQLASDPEAPLGFRLEGDVKRRDDDWRGAVSARLHSDDTDLLQELTGLRLAPVDSRLDLMLIGEYLTVSGHADFGGTQLGVDLQGELAEATLAGLEIRLRSERVHLADLGLQADLEREDGYRPVERLEELDEEQLSLQAMLDRAPRFPLHVEAWIGHLEGEQSRFDDIRIQLDGRDGNFLLREFDFRYDDALAQLRGVVDISVNPPGLSVAGNASHIPLNTLTRDLGFDNDITGILHLRTGLSGQGLSVDSLLPSLNGNLSLALEDATIEGAAYDVLATDLLAWMFSGAAMESSTVIECTMADFQFREGVARSDNLYAASARMVAEGRAEFDLGKRTLDIGLTPRSRSRRVEIPSRITLTGDMSSPRTWVSPVSTTLDLTTELMVLLPRLLLKLLGLEPGDRFSDRDCVLPEPAQAPSN